MKVPNPNFKKTYLRACNYLPLKNGQEFYYLTTRSFNQVTGGINPSGISSSHNFKRRTNFEETGRLLFSIDSRGKMSKVGRRCAAQRFASVLTLEKFDWGPEFCRWHYHWALDGGFKAVLIVLFCSYSWIEWNC